MREGRVIALAGLSSKSIKYELNRKVQLEAQTEMQ